MHNAFKFPTVNISQEMGRQAGLTLIAQRIAGELRTQVRTPNADIHHIGERFSAIAAALASENVIDQ